jgi:toxin ParE1/3/4
MSGFAFHPQALIDLDEIYDYLSTESVEAADRVIEEILVAIRTVVPFPHAGHQRPDLTSRPLRFLLVREFLVVYVPEEKPLWVIAILHGRRNPRIMAAVLTGRE